MNEIIDLDRKIDEAVKRGDYPEAAKIRDQLDEVKLKKRLSPKSAYAAFQKQEAKRKAERQCEHDERGSVTNTISDYTQFDKLKETVRQGKCSRTGWADARAGDCEHAIGLLGKSIPNPKHDGPDTEDVYGRPNGWCWPCWRSHQITHCKSQISQMREALQWCSGSEDFGLGGKARVGWQKLVKPLLDCPDVVWDIGPKLEEPIRGTPLTKQALEKLSGDLSYDNIAAAKNMLKKIIGGTK